MSTLGYMPGRIVAGESIWISALNTIQATNADIILADYTPAAGYTLAYQFAAATPITVDAVANGADTGWTLEVTAVQTLAWGAGTINFAGLVTKTSTTRSFSVDVGSIAITASPMSTSAWTAVVAACDAAMLTFAGNANASLSVDGMAISYRSMDDLRALRTYAQYMADQETGARQKRIIRTRFTTC